MDEHFLICPIEHLQCSVGQPEEIDFEVQQFKEALTKFYNRRDRVPVFFERNYKTSHMQIQAVPVPKNALNNLEDIFKVRYLVNSCFSQKALEINTVVSVRI